MPGLRELRDGMESLRSVVSCSRVTENIFSKIVSCVQELLNTKSCAPSFSFTLCWAKSPVERGNEEICPSISTAMGSILEEGRLNLLAHRKVALCLWSM